MPYDVAAIRNKLKQQMSGKFNDPDEFRPPKAEDNKTLEYRFYILPPLLAGDELKSGTVSKGMDMFYVQHANHWVRDRPHPCPRIWDGNDCPICTQGFEYLKDEAIKKDEDRRKKIVSEFMPNSYYMVNIFFTGWKGNPEDLRGKIKYYNAPKTCFDIWSETLMREDAGDQDDPRAFGVFFDESAAFQFQLNVTRHGRNNSYRTSKFLPNGGMPAPIANNPENIKKVLRLRHNLFDKIELPDYEKLRNVYNSIINGDDSNSDGDGNFDHDETSQSVAKNQVDDSVDDSVDAIIEDDEQSVTKPTAKKPAKESAKKPADPSLAAVVSDEDDSEVDDLLRQLDLD